jgi:RHS repeat-associated protein
MGDQSSSPSQVISLPQGGGALHGIGEKFSPDLFTGTGNFTVPIALPPGRNGFQPQLSLAYSSGSGNGPFGLGWNLTIPGVSRKTSKGVPVYDDAKDVFVLSGAEDLVPVPGGPTGATRHRPRTEGIFAHIDHFADAATKDYWQVRSKDGLTSLYGTPGLRGADPAAVADPSAPDKVAAWRLTQSRDPFGNLIQYQYLRDRASSGSHSWDQLYPRRIQYADYTDPKGAQQFLVSLFFEYGEATPGDPSTIPQRPDAFSSYRSGFEIRTRWRCSKITVFTHAAQDMPVRAYALTYDQDPFNGLSLLSQVQLIGYDDSGNALQELPPVEFGYTSFAPANRKLVPITGSRSPAVSLANANYELVDLEGNGLPGILEMNGSVRSWRNLGNGGLSVPKPMTTAPAGLGLADPGVQLLDANGDGCADLLVTTAAISGYYPLLFSGGWDRRSFQKYTYAPPVDLKDPAVRMIDLNGDGVTDAIRSSTSLECYFNDSESGWYKNSRFERKPLDVFPNVDFDNPYVKWADMTGDGLQDVVLVHDGRVEYWPNLGWGNWGKRVVMQGSPRLPWGYDPKRVLLGDLNGDGLADFLYVEDGKVTLYVNNCGNSWSAPVAIEGTPPVSDSDALRVVDWLGSGVPGILWSSNADGSGRPNMHFLDLTGGVKPYLLNKLDNHLGSTTVVGYASSTQFFLADDVLPATRWKTHLPFPVQVVAKTEAIDAISGGKLSTEYTYHHGYWDGLEREFRGFGRVDQRDTETFTNYNASGLHGAQPFSNVPATSFSPPTETRTWFHPGPVGDAFAGWAEVDFAAEFFTGDAPALPRPPSVVAFLKSLNGGDRRDGLRSLRGTVLRTELYALDGSTFQDRPYTVTESVYGVREEDSPAPGQHRIFFPFQVGQRTTQWERSTDGLSRFSFLGNYDAYGQTCASVNIAVPRGQDFRQPSPSTQPYLTTQTRTLYAQRDDATAYIVNRAASMSSFEVTAADQVIAGTIPPDAIPAVVDLAAALLNAAPDPAHLIAQTLNYYDGAAFQGLPFQRIGLYGALARTETLALTQAVLDDCYRTGANVLNPPEEPPYLLSSGTPQWTADYPPAFQTALPSLAGYVFHTGAAGDPGVRGFYVAAEQRQYDFQQAATGKGLVVAHRDPLGHVTTIIYDMPYSFLPVQVKDAANLPTEASYNYRLLKPAVVTDPNGNRRTVTYTPHGLVATLAVMGKTTETVGDTAAVPGATYTCDFLAFLNRGQPVSVHTTRRVYHVNDPAGSAPLPNQTIESSDYSDGFGRMVQSRAQAEDITFGDPVFGDGLIAPDQSTAPGDTLGRQRAAGSPLNVVVSGSQVYDNKGRVVEKYEPFFSTGWDYAAAGSAQLGAKVTIYYDARGLATRTVHPDGSEDRVVPGVPGSIKGPDITNPDVYEPTPWEVYTYDADDNAGRTNPASSTRYAQCYNTPSSALIDALGRKIQTVERNKNRLADGTWSVVEESTTASTYDIRGNVLSVTDPMGRTAFRYSYDLANRPWRTESIDAGVRRVVYDAGDNVVERRDSKGALALSAFDVLNRAIRLWVRDAQPETVTLRERVVYGDDPASEQTAATNALGRPYQHYDEAGLLTFLGYDFKGNLLEKTRIVISESTFTSVFAGPPAGWNVTAFRVDWTNINPAILDTKAYTTTSTYDALNRVRTIEYPMDVGGARKLLSPVYNEAGSLQSVQLDGTTYIQQIAYNAKGQRTLVAYGVGVMTRYVHDTQTFRLLRMRSESYVEPLPAVLTYRPATPANLLQDFGYEYDLVGNLLAIHDRTPGSGILNTPAGQDALDRAFTIDPLYRLIVATGRECAAPPPPLPQPWDDTPRCTDKTLARPYTEIYQYDLSGNMVTWAHSQVAAGGAVSTTNRQFSLAAGTNRLSSVTFGADPPYAYLYDACGNLTQENTERHCEWDHSDRMRVYRNQTTGAEPTVYSQYAYDSGGDRVVKVVRNSGGQIEVTVYIDGLFEYQRLEKPAQTWENNTVHVMDNRSRVATVRVGSAFPADGAPNVPVKYYLGDHLGSSNVIVDASGAFFNREEFLPYGETSFGSYARKRYRFTGKERDADSGLYYHGARYYAAWLGRWASPDPTSPRSGLNEFLYVRANPLGRVDRTGLQGEGPPSGGTPIQPDEVDMVQRVGPPTPSPVAGFTGGITIAPEQEYTAPQAAPSDLPLTKAGASAAEYYANLVNRGEQEGGGGGIAKQAAGWVGGFFASLWTPDTAGQTAFTLATAGVGSAAQAGRLGLLSVPVSRTFALAGSLQTGLMAGQTMTGTDLSGRALSDVERRLMALNAAIGIASLGLAEAQQRGWMSGGLPVSNTEYMTLQRGEPLQPDMMDYVFRHAPAVIDDLPYSGHAIDRMIQRNVFPFMVEETIASGTMSVPFGRGAVNFYNQELNMLVVTDMTTGRIVTVISQ